jgi:hypothetical protein
MRNRMTFSAALPASRGGSFFVNLPRLYWWVPAQAGYGDKRAS